jgi:plasmid stability protein
MGSLTIRIDDEALIKGLEDRALRSGRTVEEEVAAVLSAAQVGGIGQSPELIARMDALRAMTAGTRQTPSEVLLRQSRDER